MCVMEMDPSSPAFARIYSNPFAFAAFKATEPHLQGEREGGRESALFCLSVCSSVVQCAVCSVAIDCPLRVCSLTTPPTPTSSPLTIHQHQYKHYTTTLHNAEYITLDLAAAFTDAGFEAPAQRCNTPRHRTVVGRKPPSA